jgi:carnosine N-methyltransferase
VLVPGCGLGRLCVEVAKLGMACQGNEHSFYMLLAASFVLNHLLEPEQLTIHPWLHNSSNHLRDADQLRGLAVPDQAAADMMAAPGLLSMVAGDFVVRVR